MSLDRLEKAESCLEAATRSPGEAASQLEAPGEAEVVDSLDLPEYPRYYHQRMDPAPPIEQKDQAWNRMVQENEQ